MSIKITVSAGPIKTEATIKDSAYGELMQFLYKNQDGIGGANAAEKPADKHDASKGELSAKGEQGMEATMKWLKQHTASEVLNRIGWGTNPEKIVLMGASYEAHGGDEGWRNAEMEEIFSQARETYPKNFSRDVGVAITNGWIGTVTARTYKVGRAGWNKIADAISSLEFPVK